MNGPDSSAAGPNPRPGGPAVFVVDTSGLSIRGHRIDLSATDAVGTLDERVAQFSPGAGTVAIHAARGAPLRWVRALVQALGKTGVEKMDVITPSSRAGKNPAALTVSPPGQVPMHEDRCGARATIKMDDTGELKYLQKGKAVKLPQGREGPDVSRALQELRPRMKGCGTTLWMLTGEGDAKWGLAFDLGMTVSGSETIPGALRYIMVL